LSSNGASSASRSGRFNFDKRSPITYKRLGECQIWAECGGENTAPALNGTPVRPDRRLITVLTLYVASTFTGN